jgi:hypothetical protein
MSGKVERFFKGQIDASLILPVLIGLLYAGTGGWSAERWNGALAIMGLGAAAKGGYERGYATYNPELRTPRSRDEHGRFVRHEVTEGR